MKIVILVHNLTGGGAERVAALWASGFAERGDEVYVINQSNIEDGRYDISDKVRILTIGSTIKNRYILGLLRKIGFERNKYLHQLKTIIHSLCPDVCIGVMGSYARDVYDVTRDMNTIIIQTYHSSFDLPEYAPEIRKRDIQKCFINDINIKVKTVLTQADKIFIGNRMDNVFVLPNPLSFRPLEEVPKDKSKVVLACGRLDVWDVKGFDLLIKAWSIVGKKHLDWRLQIAGTGRRESQKYLTSLANECQITEQIDFIGYRKDIVDYYRKSEIFVLSSRFEGFGMVLIEAMSQGCACIACDYKGRQKEIIIDDSQGILCPTDNLQVLIDSIERMINDSSYRKQCQKNAIVRSSYYLIDNIMRKWDEILTKAVAN